MCVAQTRHLAHQFLSRPCYVYAFRYEADLFDEDFIMCWHESQPEADLTITRPLAVEIRKRALPFIEWLKYVGVC